MLRIHLLNALLAITAVAYGQRPFVSAIISTSTLETVKKIADINELDGAAVSFAGIVTSQYNNFLRLKEKASEVELYALTDHPNGVVRCYAFWALACRADATDDLLPIVMRHLNDMQEVNAFFGCTKNDEKVADFFVSVVSGKVDMQAKTLNADQRKELLNVIAKMPGHSFE